MLPVLTLKSEKTGELYDLLRKKTHSVARAGFTGDFEVPGDPTVSRTHAEISLVKKMTGRNVNMLLEVVDKNSKFGTFINSGISLNEQIDSNRSVFLKEGDRIRFGVMNSIWTVVKYPIIVCPSTLKRADKEILRNSLSKIGGLISKDWTEQCTHLCMNSITVTEKVLVCLASANSIVPLKYFIDLCEALSPNSSMNLPFFTDYQPILAENLLNPSSVSLDVDNKRKTLFHGKTFVCSSNEQLNRVSKIIKAAGGEIINYFDGNISEDTILNSKEHIFLQQDLNNTENRSNIYKQILEKFKMMSKRPISENDVGLAVIFKSTEKHCNPYYNISLVNLQSESSVIKSQTSVLLAPETEVLTVNDGKIISSVNVIPDSVFETQSHVKRPLEMIMDSDEILTPKKRALLSNNSLNTKNKDTELVITQVIEPTQSSSNCTFKPSESKTVVDDVPFERTNEVTSSTKFKKTFVDNVPVYSSSFDSVPNSQHINKKNDLSDWLQTSNNVNNNDTKVVGNENAVTKRKNPSFCSVFNNKDDDPFGYMDVDEIEEHSKKLHSEPKKTVIDDIPLERVIESTSYSDNRTFNSQQVTQVIEPTPSSSNYIFKPSECYKTVVNDVPVYSRVGFNSVPNSQHITKKNDLSDWRQASKSVNKDTKIVDNEKTVNKRKDPDFLSMFNNEDDNPFGYMDVDEIEEQPKKKPKVMNNDLEFLKMLATSNNINKQPKSVEPKVVNIAVDPYFIMNLLADAKGTGQFIDASKLSDKSSINASNDYESSDLINSVIVETVNLVVTKPLQTQNHQKDNSTLNNFKKFKRKGPGMRIPNIISMEEN